VDELGDDVVPRAGPPVLRHDHGVADELGGGGLAVAAVIRVVIADHLVRPGEDLAPVFLRYPEQLGDRLQRKLGGHVGDEVTGALIQGRPDDLLGPGGQRLTQAADRPGCEAAGDDPAQLGVVRGSRLSRMSRCISSDSWVTACAWRMIAVFCSLEYRSLRRDTSSTSACLVTTQYPSSSKPEAPRGCGFHQTGALRRSSANSSAGTLLAYRSGSVKSKPGGDARLGHRCLRCNAF
jgi:hypothetical protein